MTQIPKPEFIKLLSFFPTVELPVTLDEESMHIFQRENDVFPEEMIKLIGNYLDTAEPDELTEYVPCFQLKETGEFTAIVFWKASLMNFEFILTTFNSKGRVIQQATIGGMKSDGKSVLYSVATIDPDWIIHIIEGTRKADETEYHPKESRAYNMEVLGTGEIIYLLNEEELLE